MKSNSASILVPLGNEVPLAIDSADLRPGVIALANENRLASSTFSQALTDYAVGWRDMENSQATLDFIAPPVPVARRFEWKKADNTEAFLTESDDIRAIDGEFKRVAYKGTSVNDKTHNKGLTYRLDRDEEGAVVSEEVIVGRLMARLWRNELRRAVTALLAVGTNTGVTWGSTQNPDENMRTAILAAQLDGGVWPNRGILGAAGWALRASSHGAQATAGAFAGAAKNLPDLAANLILDEIRISKEIYQSTATVKARTFGSFFVCFHGQNGVGKDDPTQLKRFYTPMGTPMRVLRQEVGPKFVDITVEHYSNVVTTSTIGAQKLTIS